VKGLSKVLHELRREEVDGESKRADESEGDREKGLQGHRGPSVSTTG
jgi:hypothetical protein